MAYIVGLREQTGNFLWSLGFGFSIGLVYDAVRTLRLLFSNGKKAMLTADILYSVFAAFATFLFSLTVTQGRLMAYILFGELLGFFIYYFSLGVFAARLGEKLAQALRRFSFGLARVLSRPFRWAFARIKGAFAKISQKTRVKAKKAAKKSKYHLQVCRQMLYNQSTRKNGKAKEGEERSAVATQRPKKAGGRRRAEKRKNSFILSLALLLVAGCFIISLVQARIQIRRREAQAADAAARYERQLEENESLRAVADGGGVEAYMERVAREKLGYVMPNEKVYYDITPGG